MSAYLSTLHCSIQAFPSSLLSFRYKYFLNLLSGPCSHETAVVLEWTSGRCLTGTVDSFALSIGFTFPRATQCPELKLSTAMSVAVFEPGPLLYRWSSGRTALSTLALF